MFLKMEEPKKNDYRKFKNKDRSKDLDDYKSMSEVLTRRFQRGMRERAVKRSQEAFRCI